MNKESSEVRRYDLFIGGEWVGAEQGGTFESINPATGETVAVIAEATEADIDKAVAAARKAFDEGPWGRAGAGARSKLLNRVADLMEERLGDLAELETRDGGKPIRESKYVDLPLAIDCFRFYAGMARKVGGETIPVPGNFLNYTVREPVGVVGQIIPWNFPLLMATWKLAPALAAGCCCILKPAEQTSVTALELAKIFEEAGAPPGVVNVCPGFGETAGAPLAAHPDVDKIAFTGETTTGQKIMQMASGNLKKISLELGGKSPNIVLDDADMAEAVPGAAFGIFFNQGQVCCAGSRLFVQEGIYDKFMSEFIKKTESIRVGNPLDKATQMGAQISGEHLEKIEHYVKVAQDEGAALLCGGKRPEGLEGGFFYSPTVFGSVRNDMCIAQEEVFGPVVAVLKFKDIDEVVEQANDIKYGLAAGIWTRDIKKAHSTARRLKAGNVWVNCYNVLPAEAPFGGYKQSGIGRELGLHALDLYTETKNVCVDLSGKPADWYRK